MGIRERLGRQHSVHSAAAGDLQSLDSSSNGNGRQRSRDRSRLGVAVDNVRNRFAVGTTRPRVHSFRSRRTPEPLVCPEPIEPLQAELAPEARHSLNSDDSLSDSRPARANAFPQTVNNPAPLPDAASAELLGAGPGTGPGLSSAGTRYGHEPLLPTICRRRALSTPLRALEYEPYYGGATLSDNKIAFTVPDGWCAVHYTDGFRLSNGPCVGFLRAAASADASAALCDTSELKILDSFDIASSPVVDAQAEVLALVVEYRNHGAGRGVALFEPGNDAGAAVFGFSGPSKYAEVLLEAERVLLCGARVVSAPLPSTSNDRKQEPASPVVPTPSPSAQSACIIV